MLDPKGWAFCCISCSRLSSTLSLTACQFLSDLKPKVALQMLPGLPAYILFMMVRYTDHLNNDTMVRSLIQGAIATIKRSVKKKGANDIDVSNTSMKFNSVLYREPSMHNYDIKTLQRSQLYSILTRISVSPVSEAVKFMLLHLFFATRRNQYIWTSRKNVIRTYLLFLIIMEWNILQ